MRIAIVAGGATNNRTPSALQIIVLPPLRLYDSTTLRLYDKLVDSPASLNHTVTIPPTWMLPPHQTEKKS